MEKNLMGDALRILWTILSDKSFVKRIIELNKSILLIEFPDAKEDIDRVSDVRELSDSDITWKRVLGGILYSNAVLVLIQLASKQVDIRRDALYLASIYSWQRAVDLIFGSKSQAINITLEAIMMIYQYFGEFRDNTMAFIRGIINKSFEIDQEEGLRFALALIMVMLRNNLRKPAVSILDYILGTTKNISGDKRLMLLRMKEKILFDENDLNGAEIVLSEIQKIKNDYRNHIERAKIKYLRGEYEESIRILDNISDSDKITSEDKETIEMIKISSLYRLGKYKEALKIINEIEKHTTKESTRIELLVDKASIMVELNKYEKAIELFKSAEAMIKESRDSKTENLLPRIYHGLGVAYASIGKLAKGKTYLLKALKIAKDSNKVGSEELLFIMTRLAAVNINLGLFDEAEKNLQNAEKILREVPNENVQRNLQEIIRRLKRIISINRKIN